MNKLLLLLPTVCVLILFSCKKDDKSSDNSPSNFSLDEFFSDRAIASEFFEVNIDIGASFTTVNGTTVTIPANSLVYEDGSDVQGMVGIEIREVFSNSAMIFSGIFPISGSNVLNSGGEFFIQATKSGSVLKVQDWNFVNVKIPAQAGPDDMQLFFGGPDVDDDDLNWLAVDTINALIVEDDSSWVNSGFTFISADSSYSIDLDSTGWANIDAFLNNVQYFDCSFNLTGLNGLDNSNTTAYAVFVGENAVWPMGVNGWGTISNNVIEDNHLADVDMNVLVISVVNGDLYYGLLDITPAPNTTYDIDMLPVSESELDAIILGLP